MKQMLLLALVCMVAVGSAQQKTLASNPVTFIKGVVVDSKNNTPVGYANIVLKNRKDSSFVKGAATGVSGEFLLGNIAEGEYYLVVSYVGYGKKTVSDISVNANPKEINLGVIKIDQTGVTMAQVEVTGERPAEEFRPDKKVINVSQNLQATGGTAVEVLQNQPSVRVDADGTVSLRGSTNFTVLINGRPTPLPASDALRQIPATMIENIEIITNPSSKYDAEGAAGIINVNLKSQSEYSMSGLTNLGIGTRDKYNGDASATLNYDKVSLNGGIDYRSTTNFFPMTLDRNGVTSQGALLNTTDMSRRLKRENLTLRAGADYRVTPQQTITVSGSFAKLSFLGDWYSSVSNLNGTQLAYTYVENHINVPAKMYNGQLFYTYKITPSVDDLSFEATYSRLTIPNEQTTDEYQSNSTFTTRGANPLLQALDNDARRNDGRLKLNFSHKFDPKSTLEAGLQSNLSFRNFDITFAAFSWNTGAWLSDPQLSNSFSLRSNVHAAFVTYSNSLFDFDFQGGVRAEQMDRALDLQTSGKTYILKKLDIFPSFNISRKIGDQSIQVSYSRRTNRPNEALLNPAPQYTDSYLRVSGNPELQPEYIHSYELNYQKPVMGVFVTVQAYMRNSTGAVIQTQRIESDGRLWITLENLAKSSTIGADISGSFSLGTIWKFDPSVSVFHFTQEGIAAGAVFDTKSFATSARLNASATVSPSTRFQVTGNYAGRQMFGQLEIRPRFLLGASVRQEFMEKRLTVTLNAQNLINTAYMTVNQDIGSLRSSSLYRPELQMMNLTFSYNFNNFKRSATQTVDIGAEVGR
jgi:outer membrane receptor for ferrienterochelin and colicin